MGAGGRELQDLIKEEDAGKYSVPAVDRAARIIMMLGTRTREMTLAEIAAATGYHKGSVHKILATLSHHGFLSRNEETKRYFLGLAVRLGWSEQFAN
jgi:DNA-binding IclR family transcriptional regulator